MTLRSSLEDPAEKVWKLFEAHCCEPDKLQALSKIIHECVESCVREDISRRTRVKPLTSLAHE